MADRGGLKYGGPWRTKVYGGLDHVRTKVYGGLKATADRRVADVSLQGGLKYLYGGPDRGGLK